MVKYAEAVGRYSERASEELKHYNRHHKGMVASTHLSYSFSTQGPAGAFPESHTHLARHTTAGVLQGSQLCHYGEAQEQYSSGLDCKEGYTIQ